MDVRIGIIQGPRELEVELADDVSQEDVLKQIETTIAEPMSVLWLADKRGRRVGVPSARIAYVELGAVDTPRVGFGAS